jgi:hypothetical protein
MIYKGGETRVATAVHHTYTSVKTASGLDMLAGIWLMLSPFLLGFADVSAASWNVMIVGGLVTLLAASREFGEGVRHTWPSWTTTALGAWLILSPLTLGYATASTAFWNSIVMGIVIIVLSAWSAMATPPEDYQAMS